MRLTSREKEIVEVLKKEPLISQEDLALRFNITRSSVAVHISNLMKKGVILGKGYVFNEQIPVVVIGQTSLDIKVDKSSDANIDINYGGFAIEVSKALTKLGAKVKLITLVGNDILGAGIIDYLQNDDIDLNNIIKHQQKRSSRRVFVGEQLKFIEDFTDIEYEELIRDREWIVYNSEWLIIAPNFHKIVYEKLIYKKELKVDPSFCTCLFLDSNNDLNEIISNYSLVVIGVKNIENLDSFVAKGSEMVQNGIKDMIITDGTNGIITINSKSINNIPLTPNQEFDTRNNLHLFLAGIVYGLSSSYPIRQAVRMAVGLASSNVN